MPNAKLASRVTPPTARFRAPQLEPRWYAIPARPRHGKKAAALLEQRSVTTLLPLLAQVRRWSNRRETGGEPGAIPRQEMDFCLSQCSAKRNRRTD